MANLTREELIAQRGGKYVVQNEPYTGYKALNCYLYGLANRTKAVAKVSVPIGATIIRESMDMRTNHYTIQELYDADTSEPLDIGFRCYGPWYTQLEYEKGGQYYEPQLNTDYRKSCEKGLYFCDTFDDANKWTR
jgi:hypothetical protein